MNPHIFWPKDAAFVADVYFPIPGISAADIVAALVQLSTIEQDLKG